MVASYGCKGKGKAGEHKKLKEESEDKGLKEEGSAEETKEKNAKG